jgi:hypothetical protein
LKDWGYPYKFVELAGRKGAVGIDYEGASILTLFSLCLSLSRCLLLVFAVFSPAISQAVVELRVQIETTIHIQHQVAFHVGYTYSPEELVGMNLEYIKKIVDETAGLPVKVLPMMSESVEHVNNEPSSGRCDHRSLLLDTKPTRRVAARRRHRRLPRALADQPKHCWWPSSWPFSMAPLYNPFLLPPSMAPLYGPSL